MAKNKKQRVSIPERFASIEKFTEFWDTHDITDYPDVWRETDLKVNLLNRSYAIPLNPRLGKKLQVIARSKRTTVKRLVNRWLEERVRTV